MATTSKPTTRDAPPKTTSTTLIPEQYVDVPSQRLYALSLGLLVQALKGFDWLHSFFSSETSTRLTIKWIAVDALYCLALNKLRIPRLNYSKAIVLLQILLLCFVDGVLFGGIQVGLGGVTTRHSSNSHSSKTSSSGFIGDVRRNDDHLRGEHTVKMSPISTAKLNTHAKSFCLNNPSDTILIPILLNNTHPTIIRYSVTSLDGAKTDYVDLTARDLKAIEDAKTQRLQLAKSSPSLTTEDDEDDWDADDLTEDLSEGPSQKRIEGTDMIAHIRVSKAGIIRLERVFDSSTTRDARIFPNEALVVPCPKAKFEEAPKTHDEGMRCLGVTEEVSVMASGVPPLTLTWYREINGKREFQSIDGIDGSYESEREAQDIRIPLSLPLTKPGNHVYTLDSVSDGVGNTVSLAKDVHTGTHKHQSPLDQIVLRRGAEKLVKRSLSVIRRPSVLFKDCAPGHPSSLLIDQKNSLRVNLVESDLLDGPWDVELLFKGDGSSVGKKKPTAWQKTFTISKDQKSVDVGVDMPGEYSIVDVKGRHCPGDVLNPSTCPVIEHPYPTADIQWKRIHECSGDTGVTASLVLHGQPPFQVHYQQQRNSEPVRNVVSTFHGSRGEITVQPEDPGNYTYTFISLSDANYKKAKLNGPSINQLVHPQASVVFSGQGPRGITAKKTLNSCAGDTIDIAIDIQGNGPWNIEVQIDSPGAVEVLPIRGLKKGHEMLHLPIPPSVSKNGGTFQVDLVSIEDSSGCKNNLAVPGISVNVRRLKPTAKFFGKDGIRKTTILEGGDARLPLRLTGDGPWKVKYRSVDPPGNVISTEVGSPNAHIVVDRKGHYELLEVSDSQCPGTIIPEEADYQVDWFTRPSAKLASDTKVIEKRSGSYLLPPMCESAFGIVDLELSGRPPFQIKYDISRETSSGRKILDQPIYSSVQSRAKFDLRTEEAGRVHYEVKQVGDASYPLSSNKQALTRDSHLHFEQEVIPRPSAYFKTSSRLSYCLHDSFNGRPTLMNDGVIVLEGLPPFKLELTVSELGASHVHTEALELWDHHWTVDLPTYQFKSIHPHLISIKSVQDASGCEQSLKNFDRQSIWVDVAEVAAIVPFDRREHYCVGEVTQFQLEGTTPWTIGYATDRKTHEQTTKQSPFSLVQQRPGNFSITSISHSNNMCKTSIDTIHFQVHPLPSAQVAHGRDHFENIQEGNQAQILFTLIGEPPFTFTYQRAEPPARKGGKPGKVLETHTVSGVMSNEYVVYSALEGTWTVTFISDKYCRYPQTSSEFSS